MEIERTKLLSVLKRVSPALGNAKGLLPILSHFQFSSGYVTAFNDIVALRAPCPLEFSGCVPGTSLLALLNSSRAAKVVISEEEEDTVLFRLGRTRLRFARLPAEDFPFTPSKIHGTTLELTNTVRIALKIASCSVGTDSACPKRLGITCVFGKKRLSLFASDNITIARVLLKHNQPELKGQSFILTAGFLELLLSFKQAELVIGTTTNDVICRADDDVCLYGRALADVDPDQFEAIIQGVDLESIASVEMPKLMARCLSRAAVVDKDAMEMRYNHGKLFLNTESAGCEVRDRVTADLGDEELVVQTSPECLLRYMPYASEIGITPRCVVLQGDGFVVLVGVKGGAD